MGGQRVWRNRLSTATTILVLLSGSICSATIYSLDPDGIINPTASPAPVLPPWRWTAEDEVPVSGDPPPRPSPLPPPPPSPPRRPPPRRPPPRPPSPPPRGNTFRARRPTWPPPDNDFPDSWKKALMRAAFQSLRNGAGGLLGYRGITPSIQDDVDQEFWQRLSIAEFIGTREHGKLNQNGEQRDVSTLAEGLLIHKDGELLFFVSDGVTSCPCEDARTLATWSIRRLRHSGPGRGQPQYQLHFSVIPVVDDQQIEIEPVRVEPFRHNPSPLYRGIPIFTRNGPKEYNPRFIEEYGTVVSAFLRHRDSLPKYQTIKENKDQNNNRPRQFFPIYDSHDTQQEYNGPAQDEFQISTREEYKEPPREEYRVEFTEEYPKPQQEKFRETLRQNYHEQYDDEHFTPYEPQDETVEEYQYSGRQEQSNSRRQNVRYYRQRYTSYQPHQETRQQYHHHYRDQSASFSGFHQPSQQLKVFRPSTPFERFSEVDPLYQNGKPQDQKALSQVLVAQQEPLSQVSLIPVKTIQSIGIPIENIFRSDWQNGDGTSSSQDKQRGNDKNISAQGSYGDWTTINTQTKDGGSHAKYEPTLPDVKLQTPWRNNYNETFSKQLHIKSHNEQRTDSYPIGSRSLSALTRVTEHLSQNFNGEGSTSVKTKFTSWNESLGTSVDSNFKSTNKQDVKILLPSNKNP